MTKDSEQEWKAQRGKDKKIVPLCLAGGALALVVVASNFDLVWADTGSDNGITIRATDAIKNDPTAMKILYNIEWFKQRYALLQKEQELQQEQDNIINQQRALAQAYLQNELDRMSNEKDQTRPQNAFANFVSGVDTPIQGVFVDEFNYMQQKVQAAKDARSKILQSGGTMEDAMQAFNDAASFHKDKLVSVNSQLNVKYHFADTNSQSVFDKLGKVPGHA